MHVSDGVPATFPNGAHVAEVEIDPDTGVIEVVKYVAVNDFGTELNPMLVAGQVHGGLVQGIGQVLMENTVYDEQGQLLTGSFMDYAMPRAADMPNFDTESMPSPAATNPLGVKGCGEAGCAGFAGRREQRHRRRALGTRHHQSGNAGLTGTGLAGDPARA